VYGKKRNNVEPKNSQIKTFSQDQKKIGGEESDAREKGSKEEV
jgi:hypothetical protein